MKFVVAALALAFLAVLPAAAQTPERPQAAYAGQTLGDIACDPDGSTLTMSVCFQLWLTHEEELLQQSADRLLAHAREQEARSPLYQGALGYTDSVTRGQAGWLTWRDNECALATIDAVSGSIRQLSYPSCQARLTAQRRAQLDAVLVLWRADFRDPDDELRGAACILHADVFPHCRE